MGNIDERIVKNLIHDMLEADCEITAYGLAPWTNGFSFESHGDASDELLCNFRQRLDTLTIKQEEILKQWVF